MTPFNPENLVELALAVIKIEAAAIQNLTQRIDHSFIYACQLIQACKGRVVVIGMGKSGHIGGKIAATLASTGTPAFFVHPGEASHGDLGMITPQDVVLALSNSGETQEILTIVPLIKRLGVSLISLTGQPESTLAKLSTVHLNVAVEQEACPLGLAPTSSSTAALVMGDALAVSLLQAKGFSRDDFARSHPGGSLGKRLLLRVADIMRIGEQMPSVNQQMQMENVLLEMTAKKMGMTAIVNAQQQVQGIFTDGDLRRLLANRRDWTQLAISQVMTKNCIVITADQLAAEAMQMMEKNGINALLVINDHDQLIGALTMHDLIQHGIV